MKSQGNENSLVSVIIPCFNSEDTILRCLDSVRSQDYNYKEIIVIDDGSTDRTYELLTKEIGIKIIKQKNMGAPAARNAGLEASNGEFVKFLDADDVLLPNCISMQLSKSLALPKNAIIYGDYLFISEGIVKYVSTAINFKNQVIGLFFTDILTSSPLHRKSFLDKVGGFNVDLTRGQEWNLHIKLAACGVRFVHDSEPTYKYIQNATQHGISNVSKKKSDIEKLRVEFYKELATHVDVERISGKKFVGLRRLRFLELAHRAKHVGDGYVLKKSIEKMFSSNAGKRFVWLYQLVLFIPVKWVKSLYFFVWKDLSMLIYNRLKR